MPPSRSRPTAAPARTRRAPWRRRAAMALALVVGPSAVLALGATPGPGGSWAADCAEAAAGQVRVGLVVDAGTEADAPDGAVEVTCVVVDDGATSAEVLRAWADARGKALRYDPSGLLCGIGGYPATGCGQRTADGYRYWSYWSGGATGWTYSSANPWVQPARADRVEGWRFQQASGTGSDDHPPRGAANGVCPPVTTTTTRAPSTVAPPPTAAPGAPDPRPGGGTPAPAVPSGPRATAPASPSATLAPGAPVPDGPPVPDPATPGPIEDGTGAAATADGADDAGSPADGDAPEPTDGGAGATGGADGRADVEVIDAAEVAAAADDPGAGGPPVGLIGVVVLVGVLGGVAAVRSRRSGVGG